MFVIAAQMRPMDHDEFTFRKKALRDAVLCIAWLKVISILCYLSLFLLIFMNSSGTMSTVLQGMTLAFLPLQVLHIVLLFLGATNQNIRILGFALWFCFVLAAYNTVLGVMGGVYFIRTGYYTTHFFMALIFGCLAMSLLTVLCHDVVLIYAYKRTLEHPDNVQPDVETTPPTPSRTRAIENKQ